MELVSRLQYLKLGHLSSVMKFGYILMPFVLQDSYITLISKQA